MSSVETYFIGDKTGVLSRLPQAWHYIGIRFSIRLSTFVTTLASSLLLDATKPSAEFLFSSQATQKPEIVLYLKAEFHKTDLDILGHSIDEKNTVIAR